MIFTGKRAVGKTHLALQELISRIKDGDSVGVVSYSKDTTNYFVNKISRLTTSKNVDVKCISISDTDKVNHVFIDNLDMVLGDKCVCSSGGIMNVKREDERYREYELTIDFDKYTYQDKVNELVSKDSVELNKEVNKNGDMQLGIDRCTKLKELDKMVRWFEEKGNKVIVTGMCGSSEYEPKETRVFEDDIVVLKTLRGELHIYRWNNICEEFFLIYTDKY